MVLSLDCIESFGGTAAEDDDIKKFFVETPAFKRLVDGKRHVVLGRKGAGKTALYLAVVNAASQRRHLSKGLMFKQYPWQAHYKYAAGEVASTERFIASWTFLILIEAFSLLVDRPPQGLRLAQSRALGEVRRFIEQNYGTIHFDFKQAFPTGGLALDVIEVKPEAARVSAGSLRMKRSGESLGASLPRVNEWLTEKLRVMGENVTPTYILFDELDLGFNPDDSEYIDRVVGLLLAVRGFCCTGNKVWHTSASDRILT